LAGTSLAGSMRVEKGSPRGSKEEVPVARYRIPEVDLSTRLEIVLEMLCSEGNRGRVSKLAETYKLSRTRLYELQERAQAALIEALKPQRPGPQPKEQKLVVDESLIKRMIILLPMLTGSIRNIQVGLELLLGVHRSVGYISQTLQQAGATAAAYQQTLSLPEPVLAEADEIFQGRHPCLSVVDGRSLTVLTLSPADSRDATSWGVSLLELAERGIEFHDLVSDGAAGLRAGLREAGLDIPLRADLFHLVRDARRIRQRLERLAFKAIAGAERVQRAEQEAKAMRRRRGAPLKVGLTRTEAEAQEQAAIERFDLWCWLFAEARAALEPITAEARFSNLQTARDNLQSAAELMLELDHDQVSAFARTLLEHLEVLLAPLAWLDIQLAPWRHLLEPAEEQLIVWAWRHREALALDLEADFPSSLRPAAQAICQALSHFHRASSLVEALHSWLRPHLQLHRGMPSWLFPLLQLFWNHHRFQRGKRAGHSPLELAGVKEAPSLAEMIDWLIANAGQSLSRSGSDGQSTEELLLLAA
jgi:hypothetical protein